MKEKNDNSYLLFSVFLLRVQLHNYIDTIESQRSYISRFFESRTITQLLESKESMLTISDNKFLDLLDSKIDGPASFHPPNKKWIDKTNLYRHGHTGNITEPLVTFDKMTMIWCYSCMTEQDDITDETYFFLSMIKAARSDIDYLLSVNRNSL